MANERYPPASPARMPITVHPPSPHPGSDNMSASAYHHQPVIPRKPMHRSISVPLNDRMGALRHPRPLHSPSSPSEDGPFPTLPINNAHVHSQTVPPSPVTLSGQQQPPQGNINPMQSIQKLLRRSMRSKTASTDPTASSSTPLSPSEPERETALLAHLILDALQLPISHLLHIIPPHLLDESHEVLSATSLAMPVTSIEAFMESFRGINWLCDAFVERHGTNDGKRQPFLEHESRQAQAGHDTSLQPTSSTTTTTASAPDHMESLPSVAPTSPGKSTIDSVTSQSPSDSAASETTPPTSLPEDSNLGSRKRSVFDVFELTQRAADVVSGQAASKSLEILLSLNGLVGEEGLLAGMQSIADGDEEAIRYVLIHTLSRLIELTPPHSTIEVALKVGPDTKGKSREGAFPCIFELRVSLPDSQANVQDLALFRPESAILQLTQAQWDVSNGAAPGTFAAVLSFTDLLVVPSEVDEDIAAKPAGDNYERQRFWPHISLAEEPSPAQLSAFSSFGLQGKRIALHSAKASPFARNLIGLMQACGCTVSHIPLSGPFGSEPSHAVSSQDVQGGAARTAVAISSGRPAFVRYSTAIGIENQLSAVASDAPQTAVLDPVTGVPITLAQSLASSPHQHGQGTNDAPDMQRETSSDTIKLGNHQNEMEAFSFVMVDDDIETLQRELLRLSTALPVLRGALGQPTPVAEKSQSGFAFGSSEADQPHSASTKEAGNLTHAIVYFTSLKNFRSVRDVVQPIMESAIQAMGYRSAESMPEIIVVPKPAGHRRIITALHSAVHKIVVDPFFAPLATTPMLPHWIEATQMSRELATKSIASPTMARAPLQGPREGALSHTSPAKTPSGTPDSGKKLRLSDLPKADPTAIGLQLPRQDADASRSTTPQQTASKPATSTADKSVLPTPSADHSRSQASSSHSPLPSGARRSSHGGNSPMPVEALEYFSETAARMGSTGSSGMVIQSPDGRPAGIFFHPRTNSSVSARGSSSRRGTPTGSLSGKTGETARRRSAESVQTTSVNQMQSLQSLGAALEKAGAEQLVDRDGADKSSSSSIHSLHSGNETNAAVSGESIDSSHSAMSASRVQRWNEAAPGTIFSPQVGIETVLQSGKMPLATPITQRRPSSEDVIHTPKDDIPRAADRQPDSLFNVSADGRTDIAGPSAIPREPGRDHSTAGFDDDDVDREHGDRVRKGVADVTDMSPRDEEDGDPSTPVRSAEAMNGNQRAHAGSNAPLTGASNRPSAQPQPGIMIGAGFATSSKRGGGPRRPQKREKVLPPIKVLIVEDNVINQRILQQFMKRKKIQFEVAANGLEAVEKWQQGSFHLILMDIQLPVMDGIAATQEIRRQEATSNVGVLPATPPVSTAASGGHHRMDLKTPAGSSATTAPSTPFRASVIIVALTASVLNRDKLDALAAGCNDFLNKPVSLPWLEKKIIEWGSMQYILLSGAGVFDNERRSARGISRGQGALAAAAANSDIRKAFGKAPDAKAKLLASKLHLPPKRTASFAASQAAAPAPALKVAEAPIERSTTPDTTSAETEQHRTLPADEAEKIAAAEVLHQQEALKEVEAGDDAATNGMARSDEHDKHEARDSANTE